MSPRRCLAVLVALHLVIVCYSAALSSNAPPPNPPVPPTYAGCDTRKTNTGGCCVFPFTYRGTEYNDCTTRDYNSQWCATTSDYDANNNQWGECVTAAPEPVFDTILKANTAGHATAVILRAMRHWESKVPCLKFLPRRSAGAAGRGTFLSFFSGGGCYSNVGRQTNVRRQRISIGSRCDTLGVVAHEIGHALGFWHEQSRPDRDTYVTIMWRNIPSGVRHNFNKYTTSTINSRGVSYDLESLMHYSSHAFSSNGQPTIVARNGKRRLGQRYGLTAKDARQANLMYCGCSHTDNNSWCPFWKSKGYCTTGKYRPYMMKTCKKSCLCPSTALPCKDNDSNCLSWNRSNYCNHHKYGPYVRSMCRKSCRQCT